MSDEKPRSAVEIAMERLRQRDAERGETETPPTDEQKAAIAEARSVHAAKVAQLEILQRAKLSSVIDPAEREMLATEYRGELRRLNDNLVHKIAQIRSAEGH
jgi:hypothetical protein